MDLLKNVTATGSAVTWPGGTGHFSAVCAGWNGATATLQFLGPDGTTWIPLGADTTLSANGSALFQCQPGQIRVAISTATPSAGVYASANRVRD